MKNIVALSVLSIAVLGLAACGQAPANAQAPASASAPATGPEKVIEINNYMFMDVTVAPGTKVTWVNKDEVPHTVVSRDKVFRSPALDTDDKFSYVFTKPGTYAYFCSLHPYMVAKVVVK